MDRDRPSDWLSDGTVLRREAAGHNGGRVSATARRFRPHRYTAHGTLGPLQTRFRTHAAVHGTEVGVHGAVEGQRGVLRAIVGAPFGRALVPADAVQEAPGLVSAPIRKRSLICGLLGVVSFRALGRKEAVLPRNCTSWMPRRVRGRAYSIVSNDRGEAHIACVSAFRVRPTTQHSARQCGRVALVGQLFATYCRSWRKGATLFRRDFRFQ